MPSHSDFEGKGLHNPLAFWFAIPFGFCYFLSTTAARHPPTCQIYFNIYQESKSRRWGFEYCSLEPAGRSGIVDAMDDNWLNILCFTQNKRNTEMENIRRRAVISFKVAYNVIELLKV